MRRRLHRRPTLNGLFLVLWVVGYAITFIMWSQAIWIDDRKLEGNLFGEGVLVLLLAFVFMCVWGGRTRDWFD